MKSARQGGQALRWLLLGLTLFAFAWRVHNLGAQSLWRDEVDAVFFALRPLSEALAMFTQVGQNGALFFLTLRPWLQVAGASEFALRYPALCFGVLAAPLLWQVATRLIPSDPGSAERQITENRDEHGLEIRPAEDAQTDGGESDRIPPAAERQSLWALTLGNAPLLAALLLTANPYQLWYGQEGKMYSLVTFLALLSSWLWLRGIERGGWKPWLGYLITVSIAIYSHLLMILLIPFHLVWFVVAWPQSARHWKGYGLALAGLTLPYLPLLVWQWDLLQADEIRTGFTFTPLVEMLRRTLLDQSRGFLPPGDLLWLTPIFFLGLAGLLVGFLEIHVPADDRLTRLPGWRRYLLVVAWLFVPLLSIYAMSLRQPVFTPRYVIWIAPAAAMLMALGLQLVWRNTGRLAKPLTIGLLVYVLAFWGYAGWQQKTMAIKYDLRSAVTEIAGQRTPDDLLILQIPHMEYAYRYYSSDLGSAPFAGSDERLGRWAGGLWTNNGLPDEQARALVDQQMRLATAGATDIWVLRSEVEMWDSRYLMDEWLQNHGQLVASSDYHGTQVWHFQLHAE